MSKTCGEWFQLLFDTVPKGERCPVRASLLAAAREAVYAENHFWHLWRLHDPITGPDMVRRRTEFERSGKWPKIEKYVLGNVADGPTPTKIGRELCPNLKSVVYDTIAHQVAMKYSKKRFDLLTYRCRIPFAENPRILFREKAVRIVDLGDDEIGVQLDFWRLQPALTVKIAARDKSDYTKSWLREWAGKNEGPSGGALVMRKKRGKWQWIITFARERIAGERAQVRQPIEGRALCVYAPADQGDVFLRCVVNPPPRNGRPAWAVNVEANDIIQLKIRHDIQRRQLGAAYWQSKHAGGGRHGHGLDRANWAKMSYAERFEGAVKNWIEKRSAFIVAHAVEMRCPALWMQDLTKIDARHLSPGAFAYYRLQLRVQQKCVDVGVSFRLHTNLQSVLGDDVVTVAKDESTCAVAM